MEKKLKTFVLFVFVLLLNNFNQRASSTMVHHDSNNVPSAPYSTVTAHAVIPTGAFDLNEKLRELQDAINSGLISEEESKVTRAKILAEFSGSEQPYYSSPVTAFPSVNAVAPSNFICSTPKAGQYDDFKYGHHSSIIMFPIAGHPSFDKGAYHHPVGLCCYTDDRNSPIEDFTGQFICCPITTALWLGTLCYQPCGCLCAGQIPWLGDCPFSSQRVTEKFRRDFPHKVKSTYNLVLVPKGSKSQCIFEDVESLRQGRVVPFMLWSHPNGAICKQYEREKHFREYRYIESCYGNRKDAIYVRYDEENFLILNNEDLVFDVSFWKMDVGNTVNFVGGK